MRSTNGVEVIAERSVYFSYRGEWPGGHNTLGVTEPSGDWYFAEGCAGY